MITPLYCQDFTEFVYPLISNCRRSLDVLTYDWRWYPDHPQHDIQKINVAIIRLLQRRIKVRALLQNKKMVQFLRDLKIPARSPQTEATLHSKFLIVDEKYLVLGSHNLTHRAMSYNIETSLIIDDPDIVLHHKLLFNNLYGL